MSDVAKKEMSELFSDFLNNFSDLKIERKKGGGVSCYLKHKNKIYYITLVEVTNDEDKKQ